MIPHLLRRNGAGADFQNGSGVLTLEIEHVTEVWSGSDGDWRRCGLLQERRHAHSCDDKSGRVGVLIVVS